MDEKQALKEAIEIAKLSPCKSKRGVVIWHRGLGFIAGGCNQPPPNFICDGSEACRANCNKTAVHAEQEALIDFDSRIEDCEMIHVKVVDGEAVHSLQPSCWQCSKLILRAGIKYMWLYQKEGFVRYSAKEFHEQTLINCDLK